MSVRARVGVAGALRIAQSASPLSPTQKEARNRLRALYRRVKSAALARDAAEEERKDAQREAIDVATGNDLTDRPIRFSLNGKMYSGTITVPTASPVWDEEAIVDYLHKSGKWDSCSTRSFDVTKWEAEVAQGNIPKRQAEKFLHPGNPHSPYARIVEV